MKKGLFITFEGGEGVGKSTQVNLLQQHFSSLGIKSIVTREPGGTKFGENFRKMILSNEVAPRTELLAMMAARNQHIEEVIRPALDRGEVVICDRFVDSSACYQTINSSVNVEKVYKLHVEAFGDFWPDITILLNLYPTIALPRARARSLDAIDKNEARDMEYHLEVYHRYVVLSYKFPKRIRVIRADKSAREIFLDVVEEVTKIEIKE